MNAIYLWQLCPLCTYRVQSTELFQVFSHKMQPIHLYEALKDTSNYVVNYYKVL